MRPIAARDIDGLLILALVAERGSFSAAARELGVAPSAVSKRIASLEDRLDARLLVRTTRRVTLSHEGLRLNVHATAILQAWRGANQTGSEKGGQVRVNAPGLFAEVVLTPFFMDFGIKHPGILCEVSSEDRMIELATGAFDLVIRISAKIAQATAVVRTIARDRLVTVASPAYLDRFGMPLSPADLSAHRCMRYTPREAADEWKFLIGGRAVSFPVRPVFAAAEDAALRAAALAGMGLAVMPRMFLAPDLDAGRLVSVLEDAMWSPERVVHAVILEGRRAPPRVGQFVDALAKWLRKTRPR